MLQMLSSISFIIHPMFGNVALLDCPGARYRHLPRLCKSLFATRVRVHLANIHDYCQK